MTTTTTAPPRTVLGMPTVVWRGYALGCLPLFLVYMVASETDGVLSRGFNLWSALQGAFNGMAPALLLLWPLWAYTGWLERQGFGLARLLANHLGLSVVYAVASLAGVYALLWATLGSATAERARQNWFLWQGMWGMMVYWAAAGGFSAYRAVERARREAQASAQAQALLARAELAALRSKLNPHFLFNTLHSILALVRRDAVQAETALLQFSDLLRHVLDAERRNEDRVSLAQELDFTRDYLALEALRLGPRLQVRWQVDDDALDCSLPALSLQPLVENSILHAISPRSVPGQLTIRAQWQAQPDAQRPAGLHVQVEDDGPGCAPEAWTRGQGLGLKTVSRRLAQVFGPASALQVHTAPGQGFRVGFWLPATHPTDP